MYFLLFESNNLILGYVPETVGLLIFGVALVAVTIFLRWILGEKEAEKSKEENLEMIVNQINK